MRIYGPRLRELDHHGDAVAELTSQRLRYVSQRVAREFQTINDVNIARSYWAVIVDMALLPAVETAWTESVNNTYEQLRQRLDSDVVTAALSFPKVVLDVAESWLARARNRLIGIGDLLWTTMRTQLTEGMSLGESIPQLRDRLIESADLTMKRAESVARTEVIGASNAGSFYQMKATGLRATKEWMAAHDRRTRPSHSAVDGTVIDMDEKFTVGGWPLDFPHDPTAPPEETINCRCTLAWDIPEEDAVDLPLVADAYHLPGKHDQGKHGRRYNTPGDKTSGLRPRVTDPKIGDKPPTKHRDAPHAADVPWTSENKAALKSYTSLTGFFRINSELRETAAAKSYAEKFPQDVAHIHEEIDQIRDSMRPAPSDMTVFRGVNTDGFPGISSLDELPTLIGKTVHDKGFTSTSKELIGRFLGEGGEVNGQALLKINVPAGYPSADLENLSGYKEKEFLLDSGTTFIVRDAKIVELVPGVRRWQVTLDVAP